MDGYMKRYSEIINMCVMDKNKNKLGIIQEFLTDYERNRIYSYIISDYSFIQSTFFLPFKNVEEYNKTEVVCEKIYKVKLSKKSRNRLFTFKNVYGADVKNECKKDAGSISDIIFDEKTGKVNAYVISSGFFEDIFKGRKIVIQDEALKFDGRNAVISKDCVNFYDDFKFRKYI